MKVLAVSLVALALLATPAGALNRAALPVDAEAEEAERNTLDGLGQVNCVPEARDGRDTAACPIVPTGFSQPIVGIRLLDAFPGHFGVNPWANLEDPQGPGGSDLHQGYHSYPRASRGALPDLVYPGWTIFLALYGVWDDRDRDHVVDWVKNGSTGVESNEWASFRGGDLVSYVSPGSHPGVLAEGRPGERDPDFAYSYDAWAYTSHGPILYLDGSILTTYRIDTVSTPIFAPGPDERPFTPRPASLVDVDRYPSVLAGPVAAVYGATVGPIVERIGSPNSGTLFADGERVGAVPVHGTVAEPLGREVFDRLYAPDEREWSAESGSSAAGRRDVFNESYAAWADVRISQRVVDAMTNAARYQFFATPLAGRSESGGRASTATRLAVSVHTGIWRDLNRDGFIGEADPRDPYEGGARPDPDDYHESRGEFYPIPARIDGAEESTLTLRLVPNPSWGQHGVFVMRGGTPHATSPEGETCLPEGLFFTTCLAPREQWHVTGATPILLRVYTGEGVFASYSHADELLLPEGTEGFSIEACLAPIEVEYPFAGGSFSEIVWDCDVVEPWEGLQETLK